MRGWMVGLGVLASACGFQIGASGDAGPPVIDTPTIDAPTIDSAIDAPGSTCASSWLTGWTTRHPLTIDATKVTGSHTDLPVLIDLVVTAATPNGDDLVFTRDDAVTRLAHEIESYDSTTGRLIAWVKIPMLSSAVNTQLYLYSGNAAPASDPDASDVWTASYVAVWHLREAPGGGAPQMKDSTAGARHASVKGGLQGGSVRGKVGDALVFDGSNDGLDVASVPIAANFSYEAWIYPTTSSNFRAVVNNYPAYSRWFGTYNQEVEFFEGQAGFRRPAGLANNSWYHLSLAYDGNQLRMYRNGELLGAPQNLNLAAVTSSFQIGYTQGLSEWYAGRIDEVRVSNVARSAGYLQTVYRNQNAPEMFTLVGMPETCP